MHACHSNVFKGKSQSTDPYSTSVTIRDPTNIKYTRTISNLVVNMNKYLTFRNSQSYDCYLLKM